MALGSQYVFLGSVLSIAYAAYQNLAMITHTLYSTLPFRVTCTRVIQLSFANRFQSRVVN
ncbi:hypothetical protein BDR05DRAFT_957668 [Suillus weaverae]|nr:hypothetical protein BDR05DRAFT_957668 [Suillus weaverae]